MSAPAELELETGDVVVYVELGGAYGWTCRSCRAESRYVYGNRYKAERLGAAHARYCRGRRPTRPAPRVNTRTALAALLASESSSSTPAATS